MRQLTVGTSESPHVIHITSKGDILHLFNCFLSAQFDMQAVHISRQALLRQYTSYPTRKPCCNRNEGEYKFYEPLHGSHET